MEARVSVAYSEIGTYGTTGEIELQGRRDVQVNVISWSRCFYFVDDNVKREERNAKLATRPIMPGGRRGFWKMGDLIQFRDLIVFEEVATGCVNIANEMTWAGLQQHHMIQVVSSDAPAPEIAVLSLNNPTRRLDEPTLVRLTGLRLTDLQAERIFVHRRTA